MCKPLHLLSVALGTALSACGGGNLTLPVDGSPADLSVISGDGQEAPVGSELPDPLVVRLTDASAHPVSGVSVVFAFQTDVPDAAVDPTTVTTDSTGIASARVRLGSTTGSQTVEARVAELSTTFDLTALAQAPPRRGGRGGKGGMGKDGDHGPEHD
jgi:hypothetical protein